MLLKCLKSQTLISLSKCRFLIFDINIFKPILLRNVCKVSNNKNSNCLLSINNSSYIESKYISYLSLEHCTSFFNRIYQKDLFFSKFILRKSALRMYLSCVEIVNHDLFIKYLELPDTFNSWFRITELHIWLCMLRLNEEGKNGLFIRNALITYLWEDMDKKIKKLEKNSSVSKRRNEINILNDQFRAALFSYDEGILSDDKVLASALWRIFFERKTCDLTQIELLIEYIHKQINFMQKINSETLFNNGLISFQNLFYSPEYEAGKKIIIDEILKRTNIR